MRLVMAGMDGEPESERKERVSPHDTQQRTTRPPGPTRTSDYFADLRVPLRSRSFNRDPKDAGGRIGAADPTAGVRRGARGDGQAENLTRVLQNGVTRPMGRRRMSGKEPATRAPLSGRS